MKPSVLLALFSSFLFVCVLPARAQTVYRHSDGTQHLTNRMDWAQSDAQRRRLDSYWVAYSVKRMMQENSWMGHFNGDFENEPPLLDVLTGIQNPSTEPGSLRDAARRALDRTETQRSNRMVEREIILLSLYDAQTGELMDIDLSNIELAFDLEGHPVYWLGASTDGESIDYLAGEYDRATDVDVLEDLVTAVGMHEDFDLVRPFLTDVLESRVDDDVREGAVFWLHRDETAETALYLNRLAENDRSDDVREQAVFALSRMSIEAALDRLIHLARFDEDDEVRETSRFWLGQRASDLLLGDVDESDGNSELQKQAVFALAQMDDDGGVDELIELVHNHSNPVVRKQALFWLGQSDEDRALDTIIAVLKPGL